MKNSVPSIYFFTALSCEAKPLIHHYGLKKLQHPHPFAIYSGEDVAVIVSGVGKPAMAGAVAYSMAIFRPMYPLLINLGIAGHQNLAPGTLLLADKIIDAEDQQKTFYPQWVGRFPCQSRALWSKAKPDFTYRENAIFDMEAAAFYEISVKFSTAELIHCLKIISDNQYEPAERINAKAVTEWVEGQKDTVAAIVSHLSDLRRHIVDHEPKLYYALIERYHFSVSGRIRLKALLSRWDIVSDLAPLPIEYTDFSSAKQVLSWLERQIDALPFRL